jgi:hypothetical protein
MSEEASDFRSAWREQQAHVLEALRRLDQRVEELGDKLNDPSAIPYFKALHGELDKLVRVVLEGNGKDPLVERVRDLERRLVTVEAKHSEEAEEARKRAAALRSGFVAFLVSVSVALIQYAVKMIH